LELDRRVVEKMDGNLIEHMSQKEVDQRHIIPTTRKDRGNALVSAQGPDISKLTAQARGGIVRLREVVRIPILLQESYDLTILHHCIDPNLTMNLNQVESMLSPDLNHRILYSNVESRSFLWIFRFY
jgi:hypothetical protein